MPSGSVVKGGRPSGARWSAALTSDRARLAAFCLFAVLVALMGGGSRSDIVSLAVLRPAAVLFSVYAMLLITPEQLRRSRAVWAFLLVFMAIALVQLIPLPPGVWGSLPKRELVVEISALLGMDEAWRPLSLDPSRTWNAFFALFVPLSAVLLFSILGSQQRRKAVPVLMLLALASAILGFFQSIGADGLYLYQITHQGYPVGLFSNKNHQAVLLLWLMLSGCWLAVTTELRRQSATGAIGGAVALIVMLFPLLILTGSRAGLLLTAPTLLLCAWLLLRAPATRDIARRAGRHGKAVIAGSCAVVAAPLLFVFGALAFSDRQTALSRLFAIDAAEETRWQALPIFGRMMTDFLPFGSGFGSFENVFNMYEPATSLTSRYLNQAHNDAAQVIIEGGIPALMLVIAFMVWAGRALWAIWRSQSPNQRASVVFFGGSLALWLAASVLDYPLRTPLAAMLIATLTAQLSFLSTGSRSGQVASPEKGA
jgi:O-antigen ligase